MFGIKKYIHKKVNDITRSKLTKYERELKQIDDIKKWIDSEEFLDNIVERLKRKQINKTEDT